MYAYTANKPYQIVSGRLEQPQYQCAGSVFCMEGDCGQNCATNRIAWCITQCWYFVPCADMSYPVLIYVVPCAYMCCTQCWYVVPNADMLYPMLICRTLCWYVVPNADMSYPMLICRTQCWYVVPSADMSYPMLICRTLCWYVVPNADMSYPMLICRTQCWRWAVSSTYSTSFRLAQLGAK